MKRIKFYGYIVNDVYEKNYGGGKDVFVKQAQKP